MERLNPYVGCTDVPDLDVLRDCRRSETGLLQVDTLGPSLHMPIHRHFVNGVFLAIGPNNLHCVALKVKRLLTTQDVISFGPVSLPPAFLPSPFTHSLTLHTRDISLFLLEPLTHREFEVVLGVASVPGSREAHHGVGAVLVAAFHHHVLRIIQHGRCRAVGVAILWV